jgi:hypothetical protein
VKSASVVLFGGLPNLDSIRARFSLQGVIAEEHAGAPCHIVDYVNMGTEKSMKLDVNVAP